MQGGVRPVAILLACFTGVLLTACGPDGITNATEGTDGSNGPTAAVASSGDAQHAARSAPLNDPLEVTVTGPGNQPYPGASVTWSVVAGGGTVHPTMATTDAQGRATTAWTLGSSLGPQTVTAEVAGLGTNVTFSATALDPCEAQPTLEIGAPIHGRLEPWACIANGDAVDRYLFRSRPGDAGIAISVASTDIAAGLRLTHQYRGRITAYAEAGSSEARILYIQDPVSGEFQDYFVDVVATDAATGDYTVSAAAIEPDVSGCAAVWVTGGSMPDQTITSDDCVNAGFYSDRFLLYLAVGQSVAIIEQGHNFDAFLQLFDPAGALVAEDDDSGIGTDAEVVYTAAAEGAHVIDVGTFTAGETGSYTLIIDFSP